jgi:hypothetical protein
MLPCSNGAEEHTTNTAVETKGETGQSPLGAVSLRPSRTMIGGVVACFPLGAGCRRLARDGMHAEGSATPVRTARVLHAGMSRALASRAIHQPISPSIHPSALAGQANPFYTGPGAGSSAAQPCQVVAGALPGREQTVHPKGLPL